MKDETRLRLLGVASIILALLTLNKYASLVILIFLSEGFLLSWGVISFDLKWA